MSAPSNLTALVALGSLALLGLGGHAPDRETAAMVAPPTAAVAETRKWAEPSATLSGAIAPRIVVRGATSSQQARLELAIERFGDAGLTLPDLEVVFATSDDPCKGHPALFQPQFQPWRISICSDLESAYEHELAHAWEAANLAEETREQFMTLRGYSTWSDPGVPWNQRGIEGVAVVIQQGLSGLALPPSLSREQRSRLAAYELLTGSPDPRLTDWQDAHADRAKWGSVPREPQAPSGHDGVR
ncbi:MAG: hypothetical protein ACE5GC_06435 [Acidimicrobiia bacterium]